jgi:hypothetical protein
MFWRKQDKSYVAVAVAVILFGAAVFAFGMASWLINLAQQQTVVPFPSIKIMGGLIIMSLGYIQLELGLLRNR